MARTEAVLCGVPGVSARDARATARWLLQRQVPYPESVHCAEKAKHDEDEDAAAALAAHCPASPPRQPHGFNGRTGKDEDTCYTWWVGASLAMLGALPLLPDPGGAAAFVRCNGSVIGGFAKHPHARMPDPLHSYMALAGLGLLTGVGAPVPELGISRRALGWGG
jgi:geranylgeranyl transferase type-1 subunit beta